MLVVVMTSSATSHSMHVERRGHLSGVGPSFCCEVHPSVVGSMDQTETIRLVCKVLLPIDPSNSNSQIS